MPIGLWVEAAHLYTAGLALCIGQPACVLPADFSYPWERETLVGHYSQMTHG